MKLVIAYEHMFQAYLGALLKRAAIRLGIQTISIGPTNGQWIHDAPVEIGWEPDIIVKSRDPVPLSDYIQCEDNTVLLNVDQGDGFYVIAPQHVPVAHIFSEGNNGEYERAFITSARAIWSCMPRKEAGRKVGGLYYLQWGYDEIYTPFCEDIAASESRRTTDFSLHGSWSPRRQAIADAVAKHGQTVDCGGPLSRQAWGESLSRSKVTICDHDPGYLTGRIVDAMAAGTLCLSCPSAVMGILAPDGYVELPFANSSEIIPSVVADIVAKYVENVELRHATVQRAAVQVRGLTWTSQLQRIIASVTRP